jgi:hypothetical protein
MLTLQAALVAAQCCLDGTMEVYAAKFNMYAYTDEGVDPLVADMLHARTRLASAVARAAEALGWVVATPAAFDDGLDVQLGQLLEVAWQVAEVLEPAARLLAGELNA